MNKTRLSDGTELYCLRKPEAKMLDHHVEGYLQHGIDIKDGDVVFDIGANVGVFSIRAIQKGPKVKAYSFEPIPDIHAVLAKNAAEFSEGRIKALPYGVSDVNTTATFTYFPNTPALSTLHPEQWDDNPGAFKEAVRGTMVNPPEGMKWMKLIPPVFSGLIAGYLVKGKKNVKCELKTLSSVIREEGIEKIDLLKVDCEGAEWSVLQGIENEHWEIIRSAVIEVHDIEGRFEKVKQLLESKGFNKIYAEREKGLENTALYNLFALKQ
jgi:FkbM family methyltransferase